MKEFIYYGELFNIYKPLLKDTLIKYYSLYYEDNLSLQEIAEEYNVSKSYVGKIINKTSKLLDSYEEKLHLYELKNNLNNSLEENDLEKIKQNIKKMIAKI